MDVQPAQGSGGMQEMMMFAQNMREQLIATQAAISEAVVTGSAEGAVSVTMTAAGDFQSVSIDPAVIDPANPQRLESLVLAALQDATAAVQALSEERFASVTESLQARLR